MIYWVLVYFVCLTFSLIFVKRYVLDHRENVKMLLALSFVPIFNFFTSIAFFVAFVDELFDWFIDL